MNQNVVHMNLDKIFNSIYDEQKALNQNNFLFLESVFSAPQNK